MKKYNGKIVKKKKKHVKAKNTVKLSFIGVWKCHWREIEVNANSNISLKLTDPKVSYWIPLPHLM